MSTEDTKGASGAPAEGDAAAAKPADIDSVLKNLKSEMSRKMDNQSQIINEQNQRIETLLSALQPKAKPEPVEDLSDLAYDPERLVKTVVNRATEAATAAVDRKTQQAAQVNQVFTSMAQKFPEFSDSSSDAYKKASEIYERLPKSLKDTAEGMKMAMNEAAVDLGLVPSERRRVKNNDDFVATGSSGGKGRGGDDGEVEVSQKTTDFAKLLYESRGLKFDKAAQERIKNVKKNKKFNGWS